MQEGAEARRMGPMCGKRLHPPHAQFSSNARKGNTRQGVRAIGCKEAVRAEIAPAQLKASGGGGTS